VRSASAASWPGGGQGRRVRQRAFARFLSLESFGRQLIVEAHAAGYVRARKRVLQGGGAHWLWELATLHFPEATRVLD